MKKRTLHPSHMLIGVLVILAMGTFSFRPAISAHASPALVSEVPANQVAVKLKSWVSLNTILARYNATQIDYLTETNLFILQLPGSQTADQILPTMLADTDLWSAEPNYYTDTAPDGTAIGFHGTAIGFHGTAIGFHGTAIGFHGTGGLTPTPVGGADQWAWLKIALADAQRISTGHLVVVAVLDSGLTADHSLLQSNIDIGYDFVKMSSSFLDSGNGLDDDGDGVVDDYVGHGTHVAGIIVTTAPGVRIMPIRVLNSDGVGTYWDVAKGIRYAVDNGAKVINMSLSAPRMTPSLADALNYAASRGVVVVAAAGVGAGPNYPAGYTDPMAVLGVGASDRNDAISSFSGGLPSHTDVFAPGVDIYSSFPYNGFALGSGTSMSAPIVAGEAAMLIAKHPDWSASEVIQRILTKGASVSGSSAKRIDLLAALNTGIEVQHFPYDTNEALSDGTILPRIRLLNNTPASIPLSELKLRYWYTVDTVPTQTFQCDYVSFFSCPNPTNVTGTFVTLPSGNANKTSLSDTYLETGFTSSAGSLAAGGAFDTYLRIARVGGTNNYIKTNDYSFDPNRVDKARWERVTVYRNGTLVWGVEPTSGTILTRTPTRTPTLFVPTATYTKTSTSSAPTATFTRTKTSTPPAASTATVARTSTKTSTPAAATATKSATPGAATATRTSTPVAPTATSSTAGLKVQIQKDPSGNDSSTSVGFYALIVNTGSTAANNVSIRMYYTLDGTYTAAQHVLEKYYDQCGGTIQGPTLASGTTHYYTVTCSGTLAVGSSWQVNFGMHLNDWSNNFVSTNDWWHTSGALTTSFADWPSVPGYINGARVWGLEP
jgi:subtilisin family serine protease